MIIMQREEKAEEKKGEGAFSWKGEFIRLNQISVIRVAYIGFKSMNNFTLRITWLLLS